MTAGRRSAGDLFLQAVAPWLHHVEICEADECRECFELFNRMRLAWRVWLSSAHKGVLHDDV